jgi:GWxTD domain-containing protein
MVTAFVMVNCGCVEATADSESVVDSLLVRAMDEGLAHKERKRAGKRATKLEWSPRTMDVMARVLMVGGKKTSAQNAEHWALRAIKREPNNADYRATYAELLWIWDRREDSYTQAKRAIELDSNHTRGLYWASKFLMWQIQFFMNGERERGRIHLDDFAEKDREEAIGYLERILHATPDDREGRVLLALVYYDGGLPGRLVSLFKDYLELHPEDRDGHFFLGLGYQVKQELKAAYRSYSLAVDLMNAEEKAFMQSMFLMSKKKDLEKRKNLPNESDVRRFWTGKDPLFLTPVNERLMEHFRRVAYSNLRFGDPRTQTEGWRTDRGQAYIRYGHPLSKVARLYSGETWVYDRFRIHFKYGGIRDLWRFGTVWMRGHQMGFSELVHRVPEFYRDPYKWERYEAPTQIAQFREPNGKTRVEIYYALPGNEVNHKSLSAGVLEVDVRQGFFLFGASGDTVRHDIAKVTQMPWVEYNKMSREGYLFANERLTLDPGRYFLAAEVEDRSSNTIGTYRDSLTVRRFGQEHLEVSSLLAARRIVEKDEGPLDRNRFMILPDPVGKCDSNGSMSFYFEVYNLKRDGFGQTNYRVTYQTRALREGYFAEEAPGKWATAVTHTFNESRSWEPHYMRLDLKRSVPGLRAFRVVVEDLKSRQLAVASSVFRIIP